MAADSRDSNGPDGYPRNNSVFSDEVQAMLSKREPDARRAQAFLREMVLELRKQSTDSDGDDE
jgi:hypothetical protein